jgi:hypothetical protein
MSLDIPNGSEFPDLLKAGLGKKLDDLIRGIINKDGEVFELAQEKKLELRTQRSTDLKSFIQSQSSAIQRGNTNACDHRHKYEQIATQQAANIKPIQLPQSRSRSPLVKGNKKSKLPKTRSVTPTKGGRSRPSSLNQFKVNQAVSSPIDSKSHFIQPITTDNYPEKSKRNLTKFADAQAGARGTSIGDRAVVFSANGTPHYGDSYLDKNVHENLSANQATSNAPISSIPSKVEVGKGINAAPMQQQPRANVSPKSDTTANLIVLGSIATAITAILFFFQHVLIFVELILQVSSVTSTITNVAGSFVAILNNIGSLFGLGEDLLQPLSETFDSILNNTFGKDKVDYVRYQFAKVSSAFVAGQNLMNKLSGLHNQHAQLSKNNADNTSKIGNAMKAMGMLSTGQGWMNEDNKISTGIGKFGSSLDNISGLASSLGEISNDVKTQIKEQQDLDQEQAEREQGYKDGIEKSKQDNSDDNIADLDIIKGA